MLTLWGFPCVLFGFFSLATFNMFSLYLIFDSLINRSEEHTSELQSHLNLVCRLLLEKKKSIHFPVSTALVTSKFWYVIFLLSFSSNYFLTPIVICFLGGYLEVVYFITSSYFFVTDL